ncbi:MAG: hypothetical protein AAFN80_09560 [Pseudomonadota bacterium]
MDTDDQVYQGGFYSIVRYCEKRQDSFDNATDILPAPDSDLSGFFERVVTAPAIAPPRRKTTDIYERNDGFRAQLAGKSEALLLNAILIAILRRTDPPDSALTLFLRLWAEHGKHLVKDMPVRWMISSATTFGEHGATHAQRACGMGLSVLFDMIKLYESERSYCGISGRRLFKNQQSEKSHSIAFGLNRYSFKGGDLDKNMLARLWKLSETDNTIRPLAQKMLRLVMTDTRTVFARVQRMKALRVERRAGHQE